MGQYAKLQDNFVILSSSCLPNIKARVGAFDTVTPREGTQPIAMKQRRSGPQSLALEWCRDATRSSAVASTRTPAEREEDWIISSCALFMISYPYIEGLQLKMEIN